MVADDGSLLLVTHELANAMALDAISVPAKVSAYLSDSSEETSAFTRAIVRGDEEAFGQFYDQYGGRVYGLLLVLTSGREDVARELQQVVMIKVARKFRVFKNEAELWAWLSQVARNAFRDYLRAQKRRLKTIAPDIGAGAGAGMDIPGAEPLLEWLDEALQKLDQDERLLIEAFYFQKQRQSEIAEANGQTLKAVESKLARVRGKLRAFILRRTRHEE